MENLIKKLLINCRDKSKSLTWCSIVIALDSENAKIV